MAIEYQEALEIIRKVARTCSQERREPAETVSLLDSLGRVAAKDHVSPSTTPPKDTSAMDGYAVSSAATADASSEEPVTFVVKGTIAAGDKPIELANELEDDAYPCVEIMTGAQFPSSTSATPFDACVKIEDTVHLGSWAPDDGFKSRKRVALTRPLRLNANRRFAGGDMHEGDVILPEGTMVASRHVMALASVGVTEVIVYRKLRVAVWSTGNELSEGSDGACSDTQILNSNGPYLTAALRELGVDVDYNGILKDDRNGLRSVLGSLGERSYDLVITTGAVSKGKFDFIVPALAELRAKVHFHGVAIRPGHPVLFASTSSEMGNVPFFGLPGNPIATAGCFRFLVVPYLKDIMGQAYEEAQPTKLHQRNGSRDAFLSSPVHLDCFRHGTLQDDGYGTNMVELSSNQSPAIISQFAASNCWVHIPKGRPVELRDAMVYCYPHKPSFD